jgi:hypothetical protein
MDGTAVATRDRVDLSKLRRRGASTVGEDASIRSGKA